MSTSAPPVGGPDIELEIGGMTCASCANRIERKLNKLDGVTATVNFATEKARVEFGAHVVVVAALELVDDRDTHVAVTAERALLRRLEAGCAAPIA